MPEPYEPWGPRGPQGPPSILRDLDELVSVPEDQRLDVDEGPQSAATDGGDDTDDLAYVYEHPGGFVLPDDAEDQP